MEACGQAHPFLMTDEISYLLSNILSNDLHPSRQDKSRPTSLSLCREMMRFCPAREPKRPNEGPGSWATLIEHLQSAPSAIGPSTLGCGLHPEHSCSDFPSQLGAAWQPTQALPGRAPPQKRPPATGTQGKHPQARVILLMFLCISIPSLVAGQLSQLIR